MFINTARVSALTALAFATSCVTSSVDQAYEKAEIYGPPIGQERGVVLYLHGCGGLSVSGEIWSWGQFFIKKRLLFVAPNSFADSRPAAICPETGGSRDVKEQITQQRVRQAKHAIAQLQYEYPELPIIIWGHSEGAAVAIRLDDPVAGILTTGHRCDQHWFAGWFRVREDVPFLAIVGTADRYYSKRVRALGARGLGAQCRRSLHSPVWDYLVVSGERHRPRIRKSVIRQRVTNFLEGISGIGKEQH